MNSAIHSLTDRLANLPWLDSAAAVLQRTYEPLLGQNGPRELKDALYGTWLGHPLHPAMTDIPIGCWTSSIVLDLAGMERGADITLKAGTIGALGAAVTGAAQWQDLQELDAPRRLGALHAVLNITATGLYAASWVLRDRGARGPGIVASTTGFALASASAWIGGDLTYRLGIGVSRVAFGDADAPAGEPGDWQEIARLDDIQSGGLTRAELDGEALVILRDGDQLLVTSATCTHVGGPLDEGEVSGTCVTCPWHGSEFDLQDGMVIHGPATSPLRSYESQVVDGAVQVRPRAVTT